MTIELDDAQAARLMSALTLENRYRHIKDQLTAAEFIYKLLYEWLEQLDDDLQDELFAIERFS
jgi:hypothetical protein